MGLLAVALGAFGAHALKSTLVTNNRLDVYELGVQYQFYHTLALLGIGLLMLNRESRLLRMASVFMILGIFFFSGSLYILALTNNSTLGMITPVGGVCFIAGWACLVGAVLRN
ncbi:MAG: membrane protein [Bacteroidetes bacterium OLB12]|nr:MAG: membrane protein [Bacteroidetes bacterium OLB12]